MTRTGDTAGTTTISYATVDDPAAVRCDARGSVAYARCDYATTIDTLTFAPGETTKTIIIPLIDDAHVEDAETFSVVLSQLTGGGILGATHTTVVTLLDNDATGQPNPIFSSPFFVRQQYLDFLSREPEPDGLAAWLGVLDRCPNVNSDPSCDRITVSSSFFRSDEFQLKGLYVYFFYRVGANRRPAYDEIIPDMRSVTGQTPEEVYAKRASFAARPEFRNAYDGLSNAAYVEALLSRYNLTSITTVDPASPDTGAQVVLSRQQLIGRLDGAGGGTLTRAQSLRAIVQSREVSAAEYNGAFVAMQYYGYLRRTPEEDGYQAWLRYLDANPTDFRTMVNGFMNSVEYRLRFGQP